MIVEAWPGDEEVLVVRKCRQHQCGGAGRGTKSERWAKLPMLLIGRNRYLLLAARLCSDKPLLMSRLAAASVRQER